MVTDVPTIHMDMPVGDAVRILRSNFGDESYLNAAPGLVVVNDKGELAGILSPLSIIRALHDSAQHAGIPANPDAAYFEGLCSGIKEKPIKEIIDWQSISVTEDALLLDVADLFVKNRFQRIPVVKNKKVVGIIFRSRLLFAMANCLLK
jgi:CBS domain-containing protein